MAVVDNTALFRARCKMIMTRQNALKAKDRQNTPEPIPPTPAEHPSAIKLRESSKSFRLYASQAKDIVRNITELRELVAKKRRNYVLCGGVGGSFSAYGQANFMSDNDRRQFDADTDVAMRQCGKLIKSLKAAVESDTNLRHDDELTHLKMVIQLLSVYLKEVCKIVAQLREVHLKKTRNLQRVCRLANLVDLYQNSLSAKKVEDLAAERKVKDLESKWASDKLAQDDGWDDFETEVPFKVVDTKANVKTESTDDTFKPFRPPTPEISEGVRQRKVKQEPQTYDAEIHETHYAPDEPLLELSEQEQEQLLIENEQMFLRFSRTNTEIQKIETQMSEIKRLQDTFAEKVLEQEQDIEQIHVKTVHTLDNLEAANDFIRQAIQNSASRRVVMLFCLIVLTFTLLFLDWYNP
uniref:Syntaxin-18_N domain-containing protein n=1 Tax=Panagrellus redivivus TaxID=6233 RepID=A0A7E4VWZ2_PANRE